MEIILDTEEEIIIKSSDKKYEVKISCYYVFENNEEFNYLEVKRLKGK